MAPWSRRFPFSLMGCALGLLVVLALVVTAAEATIVVGLRGDDQLILGTDSKVSAPGSHIPDSCKIYQGRGCFFAISGLVGGPGFNAVSLAREACLRGQDVDAMVDGFMTRAEQPYKAARDWLLRNHNDYVSKRVPQGLSIFMIGRRNGQPVMLYTGYEVKGTAVEPIAKTEVKNGDVEYRVRAREISRFMWLNPNWFQPPYARAVERLVEAGMASGWVDVGPPVAVLQVDPTGAKWFKQGLCPAIDPTLWSGE